MRDKNIVRKHLLFYGRVQGVGFRYYSVYKARELGLTGWVQNLDDGSVEMEVQGTRRKIDELILFLDRKRYISIVSIDEQEVSVKEERDFCEIGYY